MYTNTRPRTSDEGYNSDLSNSPKREVTKCHLKIITRDAIIFKEKYCVENLLNNSANGVIYTGKYFKISFHSTNKTFR